MDGSHWVNTEVILHELHSRDHDLTVLCSAKSWYISQKFPLYSSITVLMLEDEVDKNFHDKMLQTILGIRTLPPFLRSFLHQYEITSMQPTGHKICVRADVLAQMIQRSW